MEFDLLVRAKDASIFGFSESVETILGYNKVQMSAKSINHPKEWYRFCVLYSRATGTFHEPIYFPGLGEPFQFLQEQRWKKSLLFDVKMTKLTGFIPCRAFDDDEEDDGEEMEDIIVLNAVECLQY